MKYLLLILLSFLLTFPLFSEEGNEKSKSFDTNLLYVGSGVFSIVRKQKVANFQIEYRPNFPLFRRDFLLIRPLAGAMITAKASTYFYLGVAFDFFITRSFAFTPSFAPGYYLNGKGLNLGFPLEFRSSVELSYRFKNFSRLGSMFYHISNASIGYKNPGTECLVFFYGISL